MRLRITVTTLLVCVAVVVLWLQQADAVPGPGWLSIDCGAAEPYDDALGIHWVPDAGYVSGGIAANTKIPLNASIPFHTPQLTTVRYFPNVSRVCYTIPVNKSQLYLLRWNVFHRGYDNRSSFTFSFSFDTYFSDTFSDVSTSDWVLIREAIFRIPRDNVHLCLYRGPSPADDPFLSSLELRPLHSTMYSAAKDDTTVLHGLNRFNLGDSNNSLVRYPGDPYDRYWAGAVTKLANERSFVGASSVLDSGFAVDEPPPSVMNTAITSVDELPMEAMFPYGPGFINATFLMSLFFAELLSNITSGPPRVFDIIVDGVVKVPGFNVYSEAQNVLYKPVEVSVSTVSLTGLVNITLASAPTSTLKALVNALEVFTVWNKLPGTLATDVSAIEGVKIAFGLASWTGDPCWRLPYDWLDCTNTSLTAPQRITLVNLSNHNLTGTLPDSLVDLTSLNTLHLENNKLTGPIPGWLVALTSLRVLDLRNNDLSGTLPVYNNKVLDLRVDGNPNLCVPNATKSCPTDGGKAKSKTVYIVVGVVVGALLAIAVGVAVYCLYFTKSKRTRKESLQHSSTSKGSGARRGSRYTVAQVVAATNNYHRMLGRGGFGPVFYGKLANGQEVAVKVASKDSSQGSNEFINETELLTRIHHKNLVSLVGYCDKSKKLMLLYEYVPLGTLQEHLYGKTKTEKGLFLDWKTRLQIALGAAQGLEYLHVGCNPAVFHRDVKSNNILLDDKLIPKVADFGLSKSKDSSEDVSHVSTEVKGTFGYIDPEYFISNQLTDKSDVYGYGVVLLELICARPPFVQSLPEGERRIDDWVKPCLASNNIHQIVDPALGSNYCEESMVKVVNLAIKSLEPKGVHRPNMSTVVQELREALQIETGSDSSTRSARPAPHQGPSPLDDTASPSTQTSTSTSEVLYSSGTTTATMSIN